MKRMISVALLALTSLALISSAAADGPPRHYRFGADRAACLADAQRPVWTRPQGCREP